MIDEPSYRPPNAESQQDVAALAPANTPAAPRRAASILIVEDEAIIAEDLKETLIALGHQVCAIASDGASAVTLAQQTRPHLILMDVNLPGDIDGVQAAAAIGQHLTVPIIFLTGRRDEATLQRAVLTGPLGYLIKPFNEDALRSAIEVALHRHRLEQAVREREQALRHSAEQLHTLSLIDELTQLHNRRGFFALAPQVLQAARREHQAMGLFFMDLNGLKRINDNFGHVAGDRALRDAAQVLRQSFRSSDVLARFGGDEFVAMAQLHSTLNLHTLSSRLREHLSDFNAHSQRPYRVEISVGVALVNLSAQEDLETLLARADAAMYEHKRTARSSRG